MKLEQDRVVVLETNIDDMPSLVFEQVEDVLFKNGALDVWIEHIQMKKNRPAFKLSCIVTPEMAEKIAALILEETTSSGVRYTEIERYKLPRKDEVKQTSLGKVKVKIFELPSWKQRVVPEYEDVKKISDSSGSPFLEVYQKIIREWILPQ